MNFVSILLFIVSSKIRNLISLLFIALTYNLIIYYLYRGNMMLKRFYILAIIIIIALKLV